MTGRHRGGRSLRWRLVVAVLAASVGRGHIGRHRLADAALGRSTSEHEVVREAVPTPPTLPMAPARVQAVAPAARLTVVPAGSPTAGPARDALADTLPHPVVTLFPLIEPVTEARPSSARPAGVQAGATADDLVFAEVDGERTQQAVVDLAAGAETDAYRGRHTG